MNTISLIICRDFIQRCDSKTQERLLHHLSGSEKQRLYTLDFPALHPSLGLAPHKKLLHRIHPSHLEVVLKPLPSDLITLYLSLLDPKQSSQIQKNMGHNEPLLSLSTIAIPFFTEKLYNKLVKNFELLPQECLPESIFNSLLALPFEKITALITLWGLHDLAFELHYIIDKNLLLQVHSALNVKEKHYLQDALSRKEKIIVPRINLDRYALTAEIIRNLVHQRGLIRLAHALYKQPKSVLWYLFHFLDTQRAEVLKKHLLKEDPDDQSSYLKEQLEDLLRLYPR